MIELWRVEELAFWVKKLQVSNKWYREYDSQMKDLKLPKHRKQLADKGRDERQQEAEQALTKINEILPIINQQYKNSTE